MGFTRSTTDISVHQKLDDYPNRDDGLTPEEIKKRYDYPAETIQKDLNKLEEEIEDINGASNIGAQQLSSGDTTNSNVQAKLGYLLKQMQESSLGQIPDGSITKAKLEENFANSIAVKDGVLQEGLNAEKIGNKTGEELYRAMIKIGNYTGSNTESQTIEIGFKPSAVLICGASGRYTVTYSYNYGASQNNMAVIGQDGYKEYYNGSNSVNYEADAHVLTENGFIVNKLKRIFNNRTEYYNGAGLNMTNQKYTYIAFR